MKKYLMRGSDHLAIQRSPEWVLANRSLGANAGNLLYQNAIYRILTNETCQIDMDNYGVQMSWYSDKDIDIINETYDGYLCPMADIFRDGFQTKLERYVRFMEKLTIPFYIIGAGLRAPYEPGSLEGFPFDEDVKTFIKAVLDHSALIGLRGEITAAYLKKLGFREEKDYTIIGCPSFYRFGDKLDIRETRLTPDSQINVNFNMHVPEAMGRFLYGHFLDRYPKSYYTGQGSWELRTLYLGQPCDQETASHFPADLSHDLYRQDRVRFHIDPDEWAYSLGQADLSIGGRFHGNVAALLAGCPAVFIPIDSRMRELMDYHKLAGLRQDQLAADPDLEACMSQYQDRSFRENHKKNFRHFLDFLAQNDLDHVFNHHDPDYLADQFRHLPEDKKKPITPFLSRKSMEERLKLYQDYESEKTNFWKTYVWKRQKIYKVKSDQAEKEVKRLNAQLNRKSIKIMRKIADALH